MSEGRLTDTSELEAVHDQLVLTRNQLMYGLLAQCESWAEFDRLCQGIEELDRRLDQAGADEVSRGIARVVRRRLKGKK